jgi:hypothetical protein
VFLLQNFKFESAQLETNSVQFCKLRVPQNSKLFVPKQVGMDLNNIVQAAAKQDRAKVEEDLKVNPPHAQEQKVCRDFATVDHLHS